jgi:predicted transcriptional regulator of viral defense system
MLTVATTTKAIWRRIRAKHRGWVFTPREFAALGTRAAIDQTLSRLQRTGKIRRLARGIYELPRVHPRIGMLSPSPESIAKAIAASTHSRISVSGATALNILGLSTQVPIQNIYLTEGPSRTVKIGNQTVTLKHVASSKIIGAGTEAGIVIQAVRSFGHNGIGKIPTQTLAARLPSHVKAAVKRLTPAAPAWSQPVLRQITA